MPVEQPYAELGLERLQRVREGRLADVEGGRGPAQVAGVGDRDEVAQLPQLHAGDHKDALSTVPFRVLDGTRGALT
jgi:hypothetical protein